MGNEGVTSTRIAPRIPSMTYEATLQGWHDFYSITGMAAASLVGLLFVGLSLHLRVVVVHADVRSLARVTLTTFGLMLMLSLFMVVPETDASSTGWDLVGLGVVSCMLIARGVVIALGSRERTLSLGRLLLRFGLTVLSYFAVIATGGVLVAGDYRAAFDWLEAVSIVLLVISLRNSWDLLVTVGAATRSSG
jgi:hypothetical protein